MTSRAALNNIKQRHHLNLVYEDMVTGPTAAHVWCGTWKLDGVIIGEGTATTRIGAKESAATPAVEWLVFRGYNS